MLNSWDVGKCVYIGNIISTDQREKKAVLSTLKKKEK